MCAILGIITILGMCVYVCVCYTKLYWFSMFFTGGVELNS